MDTKLDILAECSVELIELFTIFGNLIKHLEGLLNDVLLDNFHDLVLLKSLTRQVKREVLRVNNTLDESKPFGDQISAVVSDENAADIKLNIVLGPLGLKEIEGSTLGNEKDSTEFKLTLNGEVFDGEMVFPIIGEGLIEGGILLAIDVGGVASPDGLGFIELFLLFLKLLDFLGLLLFLLIVIVNLWRVS